MSVIRSQLNTGTKEFRERAHAFDLEVTRLRELMARAKNPGSPKALEALRARNKLTTEERLQILIDPGTPRLEIAALAGLDLYEGVDPGAGLAACVARICGRRCVVVANHSTVKGGTYFPLTVRKHIRAQEVASENKLPCVYLVDSGGAFLPLQAEVFPDRYHFGRIFFNQARMSAEGIAQIAVVLGSCTAGGAYVPAMSDEAIMVRGNATIFLGGPPLVKAATGEEVSAEELGGADVHCRTSGVADHLAENEEEALRRARAIIESLGEEDPSIVQRLHPEAASEEPLYDPSEIGGILGEDLSKAFSAREIIARLVDGSRFDEFKPLFGETLRCGFARICGFRVGIVANDGILFSESAQKAAHFIQLCNQRQVPLLFLQNIVGFMVGKDYENQGIAKHGAKMVNAVATSRVPKFTLIIGGSFGAGNYAMCGRAYEPRYLFSWPNSRISVMGGAQAASVLSQIGESAGKGKNSAKQAAAEKPSHAQIIEKYEREGSPFFATARMWDDGIIEPVHTRQVLALAFASCAVDKQQSYQPGIFRM